MQEGLIAPNGNAESCHSVVRDYKSLLHTTFQEIYLLENRCARGTKTRL
jgi:hypothetical protein